MNNRYREASMLRRVQGSTTLAHRALSPLHKKKVHTEGDSLAGDPLYGPW